MSEDESSGLCDRADRAAKILYFLFDQARTYGSLNRKLTFIPWRPLMKMIVDLNALHNSQLMMSFCRKRIIGEERARAGAGAGGAGGLPCCC